MPLYTIGKSLKSGIPGIYIFDVNDYMEFENLLYSAAEVL